ncbi:ATP-binding cassette domain-containing protein [Firmicutes bacterium AF25-13AC]|nr:ATP-binding cassette domain-containing protein [Firmicutes bacterium AF25-13AC]
MEFRAEQFSIEFEHEKKWYPAVTDLNMHIDAGEMVALIGESGCGKSITALSMMGLSQRIRALAVICVWMLNQVLWI